jgi:two-component system LytT family sensor kinase
MDWPTDQASIKAWPEPRFWWLQIGGWMLYPLFIHLAYTPVYAIGDDWNLLPLYYLWEGFWGFSLSLALREILRRLWHKPIWLAMSAICISVAIAAEIWTLAKLVLYYEWFPYITQHDFWTTVAEWYPNSLTILAAWCAIYYGFKYRNTLLDRERTLLSTQAAAKDAQLRMLRYQLNPHFLFNTLANICALISDKQAEKAKKMTMEISEFLRYSLAKDPLQASSLKDEIRILELYFNIEKIRYGERLKYEFDIAPESLECQVPSMLLQPLVENAIKYAIAPSIEGGKVTVSASIKEGTLYLSVKDDGPGLTQVASKDKGFGVGMTNTQERLLSFYGTNHSFDVRNRTPQGNGQGLGQGLEIVITTPSLKAKGTTDDKAAHDYCG